MRRRVLKGLAPAILTVLLGVVVEWLLLTGASPQAVVAAIQGPRPTPPIHFRRPDMQLGVVFPQWGADAYSEEDQNWRIGLNEIQQQTAAQWIEMPINLYQATKTSTTVTQASYTPSPESVYEGIRAAKAMGYHVFVVPLLSMDTGAWAGLIQFHTVAQTQQWFASYWQALAPYAQAAAAAGADQLAIATELDALAASPGAPWEQLIAEVHSVFPGPLTFDMNFTALARPVQPWMRDPLLRYIGVSEYQPLTDKRQRVDPAVIPVLWNDYISTRLDNFAARLGKPIIISEVGYRNSADALYHPWEYTTPAPPDPQEQAAAYDAALRSVISDPFIEGVYIWAWSQPPFSPNWLPAAGVLHHWYTSPEA